MMVRVAEVELHDEVVEWLAGLGSADWNRAVVVIDRLASLGSRGCRSRGVWTAGCSSFGSRWAQQSRRITYRFTSHGRIVLLTTFRKHRDNERAEVARARNVAERCARSDP